MHKDIQPSQISQSSGITENVASMHVSKHTNQFVMGLEAQLSLNVYSKMNGTKTPKA